VVQIFPHLLHLKVPLFIILVYSDNNSTLGLFSFNHLFTSSVVLYLPEHLGQALIEVNKDEAVAFQS